MPQALLYPIKGRVFATSLLRGSVLPKTIPSGARECRRAAAPIKGFRLRKQVSAWLARCESLTAAGRAQGLREAWHERQGSQGRLPQTPPLAALHGLAAHAMIGPAPRVC